MTEKSTVLVQCNRRGSVSSGPLTLKPGVNEVNEDDFLEFRKTKLGAAVVKLGWVTYVAEPVQDLYEPEPETDDNKSEASDDNKSEAPSEDDGSTAPTLVMSAKDAIEYVSKLEDHDELYACYSQDERKTVRAACAARAEELQEDDEGDDPEPETDDNKSEEPDDNKSEASDEDSDEGDE